jgi:hypothetical protein
MKLHRMKDVGAVAVAGLLMTYAGCGGGSASPTSPAPPVQSPAAPSTPTPPPASGGSVDAVCRAIGYGTPKVGCDHVEIATMLPLMESAIDQLVKTRPQIFDTDSQMGDGGYRVLDEKAYFDGMQTTLAGLGVCSQTDGSGTNLQVKNENELDETYAILNSKGFIRRGWGSYLKSCIPSSFPLSPADQFAYVRTAFFGFKCDPGIVTPPPFQGDLLVVCSGIVTATPKDANGLNTPASVHGNDVSWNLRSGAENVSVYPAGDGNIFNYIVQARQVGTFSLCATVKGVEGCLNGRVVPYP